MIHDKGKGVLQKVSFKPKKGHPNCYSGQRGPSKSEFRVKKKNSCGGAHTHVDPPLSILLINHLPQLKFKPAGTRDKLKTPETARSEGDRIVCRFIVSTTSSATESIFLHRSLDFTSSASGSSVSNIFWNTEPQ